MFLASEDPKQREAKIQQYLHGDPSSAVLGAAGNFEWTVCRAILFLSTTPNREVRRRLASVYGLDRYKKFWREELSSHRRLPRVVRNWSAVRDAFDARNRLVHGRDRYTRNMATPHVESLLIASANIRAYCEGFGTNFRGRLPVRRRAKQSNNAVQRTVPRFTGLAGATAAPRGPAADGGR